MVVAGWLVAEVLTVETEDGFEDAEVDSRAEVLSQPAEDDHPHADLLVEVGHDGWELPPHVEVLPIKVA